MAQPYDWPAIRHAYETGSSIADIQLKYGAALTTIKTRIRRENWQQNPKEAIHNATEAKLAGMKAGDDPKTVATAIDAEAKRKAIVIQKQRRAWNKQEKIMNEALTSKDYEIGRVAKITAEALRIRQEGERRAWGINDNQEITHKHVGANNDQRAFVPPTLEEFERSHGEETGLDASTGAAN
uniref:Terminase small subunit n=1 Tax=Magnetococcus massalia (strain MO-1) TaxID=451514 RepID=A0A1S7LER9_MAGMO|nr:Conserved protein of unknown function [Candidatus Magnetococcus massalia]